MMDLADLQFEIGNLIRKARIERGLTRAQLGEAILTLEERATRSAERWVGALEAPHPYAGENLLTYLGDVQRLLHYLGVSNNVFVPRIKKSYLPT